MIVKWAFCLIALAGAPSRALNYDALSEPDGDIATREQELAAWAMLHDPEQVDALYADAANGNVRATHIIEQLEATFAASGRQLAERASGPDCLLPVVHELASKCRPSWTYLDFLSQERPGVVNHGREDLPPRTPSPTGRSTAPTSPSCAPPSNTLQEHVGF
jgi:hypothetical protein